MFVFIENSFVKYCKSFGEFSWITSGLIAEYGLITCGKTDKYSVIVSSTMYEISFCGNL